MSEPAAGEVTALLRRWSTGDERALDQLFPIVYDELRRLAAYYSRMEAPGPSPQAAATVQVPPRPPGTQPLSDWAGRTHVFAVSSRIIRHLLVDPAREIHAQKRGGGAERLPIEAALEVPAAENVDLLAIDAALEELAAVDSIKARIIELRFFGGLSVAETATVLHVAPATVKRHFSVARLWLHRRLREDIVSPART